MKERRDTELQKYYFLRNDFEALEQRIEWLRKQIIASHEEMGDWCGQSSETWHDNFGYEEGSRSSFMWSTELRKLLRIRNNVIIADPQPQCDRVFLGSVITLENEEDKAQRTFRVGSYLVFKEDVDQIPTISYTAPLVAPFLGSNIGDSHEVKLSTGQKSFTLVNIQ